MLVSHGLACRLLLVCHILPSLLRRPMDLRALLPTLASHVTLLCRSRRPEDVWSRGAPPRHALSTPAGPGSACSWATSASLRGRLRYSESPSSPLRTRRSAWTASSASTLLTRLPTPRSAAARTRRARMSEPTRRLPRPRAPGRAGWAQGSGSCLVRADRELKSTAGRSRRHASCLLCTDGLLPLFARFFRASGFAVYCR